MLCPTTAQSPAALEILTIDGVEDFFNKGIKILTALTVVENYDLNKVITVPKDAVGVEGSSIYLREGEKLTVKELLYGLMLRSGNDCAECLALTCGNSKAEFIDLMNKTARKYGAINSNFLIPIYYRKRIGLSKPILKILIFYKSE